jgi:hypothetical protein
LGRKVTAAMNIHSTIEELLYALFSIPSVPHLKKVGDQIFPELLVSLNVKGLIF